MKGFSRYLALVILYGTLISATLIGIGLLWYLSAHLHETPSDHIFSGEPKYLRDPIAMLQHALASNEVGQRRSLIMIGVIVLLVSPLVRVALATVGFAFEGDFLYILISSLVFVVLAVSFFW